MKIFKYSFIYNSSKEYKGTIEHMEDLETTSKRNMVKQIVASKYGLDISKMSSNFYVTRDYEAEKQIKNQQSNKISNNNSSPKKVISESESAAIYAEQVERNRISRETRWAEKDRQRERDDRQRIIDIEEQRLRDEKEAREKAERRARANELRSQGKNFQAFLVEFQNGVIAVSIIIGLALFFFFFNLNKKSNTADAMKINTELEQIEDSVKIYINENNFDRALLLTNKLVHNSHENMEHLDFDAWSGYPKFDEYWTKKREAYKNIILNGGKLNLSNSNVKGEKTEQSQFPEFTEAQDEITVEGISDKIYFYNNPSEDSKTKGYFVKGQQGKLLGEAGDFSKIRFEFNGKVTEKFVLSNQIQEVDTYVPAEPDTEGLDPEYQEN